MCQPFTNAQFLQLALHWIGSRLRSLGMVNIISISVVLIGIATQKQMSPRPRSAQRPFWETLPNILGEETNETSGGSSG